LFFLIKSKKPEACIDLLCLKELGPALTTILTGLNLCKMIKALNAPTADMKSYDFILVNDCSRYLFPADTVLKQWLRKIIGRPIPPCLLSIEQTARTGWFYHQKKETLWRNLLHCRTPLDYLHFYDRHTRQDLHRTFRQAFYQGKPGALSGITINIGSFNKNKGANNNLLFQNRMAEYIRLCLRTNPQQQFTLIGFSNELVSAELKQILLTGGFNIINLLDKTGDIYVLMNVLFRSDVVIVRNTGILHLAGLCNCKIITFYANRDLWRTFNLRPDVIRIDGLTPEKQHLLYHEKWSPFSDEFISINEYKPGQSWYNRNVIRMLGTPEVYPYNRNVIRMLGTPEVYPSQVDLFLSLLGGLLFGLIYLIYALGV
jgi:hypothetical protein